jgi:predicted dehydrogenase
MLKHSPPPLRFALIGPGQIAAVFAESLVESGIGSVACVYGRRLAAARALTERFGGEAVADLEAALGHSAVQAVYVATPHSSHAEIVRAALEAGLPVLCEKPLTTTPAATRELFALAASQRTLLAEGYMYRTHPQIERAMASVASGELGDLQRLQSHFGFRLEYEREHRLFAPELGGGAILDVGGYPVSLALAIARASGVALERALRPEVVSADGQLAASGVDGSARLELRFANGLIAELRVSLQEELGRGALLQGQAGSLRLEDPFLPGGSRRGRGARLWVESERQRREERIDARLDCFALEAQEFARCVQTGEKSPLPPLMTPAESIALADLLDLWRERLGAL